MIWVRIKNNDSNKNEAEFLVLQEELENKIKNFISYDGVEKDLVAFVEKEYNSLENLFKSSIGEYQEAWDLINDMFFYEVERVTEIKWKNAEYNVVLSPFHKGISNLGGNTIVRSIYENPKNQKRITAHEILMSHLWNIIFENFPESENEVVGKYWALNEITTTAILGLETTLNSLWTSETKGFDGFLTNYPQLNEVKETLKDIYLRKSGFKDYLKQALSVLNKTYK